MDPIRSHDGLFRFVFGEPEQMADLLRSCLPPALAAAIRWSTLRRLPDTFVDKVLGARRGDLFFAAEIGASTVLLRIQTEHKSSVDWFTALQLTGYAVRMLEAWRDEHGGAPSLPAVVTFVLYHGDAPWDAPTSVHELVDVTGWDESVRSVLLPLQLRQPFLLLDLSQIEEPELDRLPGSAITRLTLRFLQFLRGRQLDEAASLIERWRHLVAQVRGHPRGQDILVALCSWYLGRDPENPETLRAIMTKLEEEEQPMRSMLDLVLEMGEERGIQKGVQRGLQQGMHALLVGMLQARFGALAPDVLTRLEAADAATLQRWSLRVLSAGCVEDVLAD